MALTAISYNYMYHETKVISARHVPEGKRGLANCEVKNKSPVERLLQALNTGKQVQFIDFNFFKVRKNEHQVSASKTIAIQCESDAQHRIAQSILKTGMYEEALLQRLH